ncbi:hypothetical protein [Paenarthrobacter nicotinovorans]|uniref:hypothetical protein n=1 Tax=Paenarthrobacter nicotinovorans TaxID=29320 RepID=UPI0011A4B96F|nr:hypothetical protein [Paenarthrobacter nicotinovorans]
MPHEEKVETLLSSLFKSLTVAEIGDVVALVEKKPGSREPALSPQQTKARLNAVLEHHLHQPLTAEGKLILAALNMERSVEALGPALADIHGETSPQLARSMQATENAWREMETEFGLLTSIEVSKAVGSKFPNRSYASDQRAAGKLLAIKRPGGFKYPGFQIDPPEHALRPVIKDLLELAAEAGRSEAGLALWIISPTGYLDGARPVDLLDEPETVVEAARQSFNVQW